MSAQGDFSSFWGPNGETMKKDQSGRVSIPNKQLVDDAFDKNEDFPEALRNSTKPSSFLNNARYWIWMHNLNGRPLPGQPLVLGKSATNTTRSCPPPSHTHPPLTTPLGHAVPARSLPPSWMSRPDLYDELLILREVEEVRRFLDLIKTQFVQVSSTSPPSAEDEYQVSISSASTTDDVSHKSAEDPTQISEGEEDVNIPEQPRNAIHTREIPRKLRAQAEVLGLPSSLGGTPQRTEFFMHFDHALYEGLGPLEQAVFKLKSDIMEAFYRAAAGVNVKTLHFSLLNAPSEVLTLAQDFAFHYLMVYVKRNAGYDLGRRETSLWKLCLGENVSGLGGQLCGELREGMDK